MVGRDYREYEARAKTAVAMVAIWRCGFSGSKYNPALSETRSWLWNIHPTTGLDRRDPSVLRGGGEYNLYNGLGCSASASRYSLRLFLSTTTMPVSTNVGMGGARAVCQSLNW